MGWLSGENGLGFCHIDAVNIYNLVKQGFPQGVGPVDRVESHHHLGIAFAGTLADDGTGAGVDDCVGFHGVRVWRMWAIAAGWTSSVVVGEE